MAPMTNRVAVWKIFWGLFIATNNFAFEVKAILGLESTFRMVGQSAGRLEKLRIKPTQSSWSLDWG